MCLRARVCVCVCVLVGGGVSPREKERLQEKKGIQSGLTLRGERFRVRRGSSGRDHHLPSLSLFLPPELSFLIGQSS